MVIGYRHTGIIAKNFEAMRHFYEEILRLEVIQEFDDESEYIATITGLKDLKAHFVKMKTPDGFTLELLEYPTHPTSMVDLPIHNVGLMHLAFRINNAQETHRQLIESGIVPLSSPVRSSEGFAVVFFVRDPDGNRVELVEMLT